MLPPCSNAQYATPYLLLLPAAAESGALKGKFASSTAVASTAAASPAWQYKEKLLPKAHVNVPAFH
jgi:hypothetical protein